MNHLVREIINKNIEISKNFGKAALHAIYPDNFEYYLCSFELLNFYGERIAFLQFPVMPDSISESTSTLVSVTKTNSGIVSVFNNSFNPVNISISGNFGRNLKVLFGNKEITDNNISSLFNDSKSAVGGWIKDNAPIVKTGYGLIKMLRKIMQATRKTDENNEAYCLVFRNYFFNTAYVVEIMNDSYFMNMQNNMIWGYSIEMKAVGNAENIFNTNSDGLNWSFLKNSGISIGNELSNKTILRAETLLRNGIAKI